MADGGLGRRAFLRSTGAGAALAAIGAAPAKSAVGLGGAAGQTRSGSAKNVILLIGDGMGLGSVTLGDMYSRLTRDRRLHWVEMLNDPRVRSGLVDTQSANGFVPDSASTATAWSTGVKVNNGAICFTPEGDEPEPLIVEAIRRGKVGGIVTTSRLTDATPACMYANVPKREMEGEIAQMLRERGLSVMLGGGAMHLDPVYAASPDPTCMIARDLTGLRDATSCGTIDPTSERLLGLFGAQEVPYILDRTPQTPSLLDMSMAALRWLGGHEAGFVLLIEAGRIDHAAHANDAASLVREMVEFDDVIRWASDWAMQRDDTLVLITTDHANANAGLTHYAEEGDRHFARLQHATHSFEWIFDEFKTRSRDGGDRVNLFAEIVKAATGADLKREDVAALVNGTLTDPFRTAGTRTALLGSLLANHCGVAFVSPNHTSDFVLASAFGPGADGLRPFQHNTPLHGVLRNAMAWG